MTCCLLKSQPNITNGINEGVSSAGQTDAFGTLLSGSKGSGLDGAKENPNKVREEIFSDGLSLLFQEKGGLDKESADVIADLLTDYFIGDMLENSSSASLRENTGPSAEKSATDRVRSAAPEEPETTEPNNPTAGVEGNARSTGNMLGQLLLGDDLKPPQMPNDDLKAKVDPDDSAKLENAVLENANSANLGGVWLASLSGNTESWDKKNFQNIALTGGVEIKENASGEKYIHIAPNYNNNTRYYDDMEKSAANPKGLDVKISPVALDLSGNGKIDITGESTARNAITQGTGRTVNFDLDGDGEKEAVEWMAGTGDGLLVDDRDGRAADDLNGNRLFGDRGGKFDNGYEVMKSLDTNADGKLTGKELEGLKVWVDNGDARYQSGEFKSLEELGLTSLDTNLNLVVDERGDTLMQSEADSSRGKVLTEDIWFKSLG